MKAIALFCLAAVTLLAQTPPPHFAWNGDKVHEIRLRFAQPGYWEQLAKNYLGTEQEAEYLEASLEWGPYQFASVGVRFKGNSSYSGARTLKKPFRIKLNEFVKGQKIEGIGAFNLSNGINDPSLVRENLYYEIAAAFGLKAPRANYAALYVNDEYLGLYVLGEVVNSDFLKNYFGKNEDTGNLYKANIGATFDYLGEDKVKYKDVWEKQTNEDADDWSDLIELCRIIGQTPAAELKTKLEPLMDIDSALTALALDNLTVNLDSYVVMSQNFNIYRRPSDRRWVWIVWDPSLAFGAFPGGATGQAAVELPTEFVQANGGPGGGGPPGGMPPPGLPPGQPGPFPGAGNAAPATRPLATKLWAVPEYLERYRQIYRAFLDRDALGDGLLTRANTLRDLIRPYVVADKQLLVSQDDFARAITAPLTSATQPGRGFGSAPGIQTLVEGRRAWLKSQFDKQTLPTAALDSPTTALTFVPGGPPQRIDLNFTGIKTPPSFSAYASTQTGGTWLTTSVTGGPLPGAVSVAANAAGLAPGSYTGAVTVYLGGATPLVIPVTLTVPGN
ncbi:MAG: CotH kinase family protein [Bryobacteraceae bacterium]|nr:CotH kinase family protein [Bryobacteraceae bacterium]